MRWCLVSSSRHLRSPISAAASVEPAMSVKSTVTRAEPPLLDTAKVWHHAGDFYSGAGTGKVALTFTAKGKQ
jgi:hypothetical protein